MIYTVVLNAAEVTDEVTNKARKLLGEINRVTIHDRVCFSFNQEYKMLDFIDFLSSQPKLAYYRITHEI